MSAAATTKGASRLAAMLGRLGSEHEGERATAAAMADKHVRSLGMDWNELVARAFAPSCLKPVRPIPPAPAPFDFHAKILWLRACWSLLNSWEQRFVGSVADQPFPLSGKQIRKLLEIAAAVERRCGADEA